MKAVIQRVTHASVSIRDETVASINAGLLVLLGVESADTPADASWLAGKIARMRICNDETGKMNRSVIDSGGELLVVSQFTLHASTHKGNRPSFIRAAHPSQAQPLYELFCQSLENETQRPIQRGVFGAEMLISLCNNGPVTIIIDSQIRE